MDPTSRRTLSRVALLLLLCAAVWPHRHVLTLLPVSRDAILWVTSADPSSPRFWDWTFTTRHFRVGYRPVTALSFTLDHLLAGTDPLLYRCTDLILHGLCVFGTWAVFRRLWSTPAASPLSAGDVLGEERVAVGALIALVLDNTRRAAATVLALTFVFASGVVFASGMLVFGVSSLTFIALAAVYAKWPDRPSAAN